MERTYIKDLTASTLYYFRNHDVKSLTSKSKRTRADNLRAALELKTVPTPEPIPGTAIIKVLSAPVLSYAKHVYNGMRKYPYPTPFTPGSSAIGRVAALGADCTSLSIGQLVFVDPVIRSRDNPSDIFLMGLHQGATAGSKKMMESVWTLERWNVGRILSTATRERYTEAHLATMAQFMVVYGGLSDIGLRAGETIVVVPATGGFGGAAVAVSLAMGASVIAMGRTETTLAKLSSKFPERVKTVKMTGDLESDAEALRKASNGCIDAVYDIPPPMAAKSTHLKSCIMAIKHSGRISLMDGIYDDVPIPYHLVVHKDMKLQGKWMYGKEQIKIVIKMIETGVLKIGNLGGVETVGDFTFENWEEALDAADEHAGWGSSVVMRPAEMASS
ncbi:NAD(P)-binding protein [Pleomassaria siparia CBS 279.74]|uniref:NAD(P)-binding protein n=1 Tax=Pleomassaria siparia CBS 279.74 TaxID=1314801 RepID=A0A6G1KPS6_9PLEO|nr:NAD(P)-binding protein [Pleomassaria siparia CBS 279.74]